MSILLLISYYNYAQCEFSSDNSGTSCENAIALCAPDLFGLQGSLSSVPNTNAPTPLCPNDGEADNIMWYRFFTCEENIELLITPANCTTVDCDSIQASGMQAGLYRDCNFEDVISCSVEGNMSSFTLVGNGLVPGELVYLFLDGYKGSVCDYEIDAIAGIDSSFIKFETDSLAMPEDGMVTGESRSCAGGSGTYSFTNPTCIGSANFPSCRGTNLFEQNLICYEWIIEPPIGFEFIGDSTAAEVEINWLVVDTFQISVIEHRDQIVRACSNGLLICGDILPLSVSVEAPVVEILPVVTLCEGDTFEFCGEMITSNTTITCEVDTCQFEVQEIIFLEPIINDLGTMLICSGMPCYSRDGVDYCNAGSYTVQNLNSQCLEFNEFRIIDFDDSLLQLESSNDIDCIDRAASLTALLSLQGYNGQIDYAWTDQSGNTLSTSTQYTVSEGGMYRYTATIPGINCEIASSIIVSENTLEVTAIIDHDTINCENTETTLSYSANQNIISHQWDSRSGFDSQLPNPKVSDGGV